MTMPSARIGFITVRSRNLCYAVEKKFYVTQHSDTDTIFNIESKFNKMMLFLCLFHANVQSEKVNFDSNTQDFKVSESSESNAEEKKSIGNAFKKLVFKKQEISVLIISVYAVNERIAIFLSFSGLKTLKEWKGKALPDEATMVIFALPEDISSPKTISLFSLEENPSHPFTAYVWHIINQEKIAMLDRKHFSYARLTNVAMKENYLYKAYFEELKNDFDAWNSAERRNMVNACNFLHWQRKQAETNHCSLDKGELERWIFGSDQSHIREKITVVDEDDRKDKSSSNADMSSDDASTVLGSIHEYSDVLNAPPQYDRKLFDISTLSGEIITAEKSFDFEEFSQISLFVSFMTSLDIPIVE
ncbi:MAG: hypothetical protein ABW189_06120 [Rickettsiales bacterium]